MELLQWLLFAVLPALAAVLLLVGVGGARLLAPALAAAVLVPFAIATGGLPPLPWQLRWSAQAMLPWAWYLLLAAGVFGAAHDLRLLPRALLLVGDVALVGWLPWALSAPLRALWQPVTCAWRLAAAWTLVAAVWWGVRGAAKARPGPLVPLVGVVVFAADALVLRALGRTPSWQLAGVAAVALLGALGTAAWRRPFACGTGAALVVAVAHVGLLWARQDTVQIDTAPMLLALTSPLPLWFAARPPKRERERGGDRGDPARGGAFAAGVAFAASLGLAAAAVASAGAIAVR